MYYVFYNVPIISIYPPSPEKGRLTLVVDPTPVLYWVLLIL